MLVIKDAARYREALAQAERLGLVAQFVAQLEYLSTYGQENGRRTRCLLYRDHSPFSFEVHAMQMDKDGKPTCILEGGLIYHGPVPTGGAEPTFAVTVTPVRGWQVHT